MTESSSPKKLSTVLPLIIAGVGLVLLGVAAFALLPRPDSQGSTTEYSTIPLEVNYAAPDLSLTALDGTPTSLADYRGQVVLVNLWATWCPPCKAEMPTLQSFYDKYQADGFAVVAINDGDPTADVAQFVKDYALTFRLARPEVRGHRAGLQEHEFAQLVCDRPQGRDPPAMGGRDFVRHARKICHPPNYGVNQGSVS